MNKLKWIGGIVVVIGAVIGCLVWNYMLVQPCIDKLDACVDEIYSQVIPTPSQTTHSPEPTSSPSATAVVVPSWHIPILMYHHIGSLPPNPDAIRKGLTVSAEVFKKQLKVITDRGYQAITFYDLDSYLTSNKPLPKKPIILTFDDGYQDNFVDARPLLEQSGLKAVFFIITDKVGLADYMTWTEIKLLKEAGNEIGSHTRTHPDLAVLASFVKRLQDEVVTSQKLLEDQGMGPIISFCYPSGKFTAAVAVLVGQHYHFARTTKFGIASSQDPADQLPAVRMNETTDLAKILAS